MSNQTTAVMTEPQQGMVAGHQPGQGVFKSILSEDINWKPFAAFPPSVRLAVIVGQPSEAGPYTIRVRVPRGVKLMPHRHPEDRVYTVISGVFYIGLGEQFDGVLACLPQTTWVAAMLDTREQICQHPVHLSEFEVQVADFA